jgi:hypothetical protein
MALWTPALIADYSLAWHDTDSGQYNPSTGNWSDKTGKGNGLSQGTSGNRPALTSTGPNGFDAVVFTTDDFLKYATGFLNGLTEFSLFFVRKGAVESNSGVFGPTSSNSVGLEVLNNNVTSKPTLVRVNNSQKCTTGAWTTTGTDYSITSIVADSTSTRIRKNGTGLTNGTGIAALNYNGIYSFGRYSSTYYSNQSLVDILFFPIAVSTEIRDKIEGYLAWRYALISLFPADFIYKSAAPTSGLQSYLEQYYGLKLGSSLDQKWTLLLGSVLEQYYGLKLGSTLDQVYFDAPVVRNFLTQPYRDANQLKRSLVQVWGEAARITGYIDQEYALPEWMQRNLEQRWAITATEIKAVLDAQYNLSEYNLITSKLDQPYVIAPAESLEVRPVITVYLGSEVMTSHVHINIEGSRDEGTLTCELLVMDQVEYLRYLSHSLDPSSPNAVEDNLAITVDGVPFLFKITPKPSRNRSAPGVQTYTVKGSSRAVLLDRPFATPLLEQIDPEMASEICETLAGSTSFTWEINDRYVPSDVLYANDETPVDIIRKLAEVSGAIVQSDPDGSLHVRKFYPYPVPQWQTEAPAFYLTDQDNFFSLTETPETRPGYNRYTISDQLTSQTDLTYEEKAISDTVKQVKVYQTPWDGIERPFEHSGGSWVMREPLGIVEETIGPEQVDIVAGTGKTQKPIYTLSPPAYKQTQLGAITFGEDGTLKTEVSGQSLVDVTYTTKYWLYKITDTKKEAVQCYAIETENGQALGTIILNFADAAASGALVVVEMDDDLNRDGAGEVKTSYFPGDQPCFLVHHDATVRIKSTSMSSGFLAYQGLVYRARTNQMQFATDTDAQETPHIPISVSASWYGRSPSLAVDGRKLTASEAPSIGDVTHSFMAHSYRITPPEINISGEEKYYILTVVEIESI